MNPAGIFVMVMAAFVAFAVGFTLAAPQAEEPEPVGAKAEARTHIMASDRRLISGGASIATVTLSDGTEIVSIGATGGALVVLVRNPGENNYTTITATIEDTQ